MKQGQGRFLISSMSQLLQSMSCQSSLIRLAPLGLWGLKYCFACSANQPFHRSQYELQCSSDHWTQSIPLRGEACTATMQTLTLFTVTVQSQTTIYRFNKSDSGYGNCGMLSQSGMALGNSLHPNPPQSRISTPSTPVDTKQHC